MDRKTIRSTVVRALAAGAMIAGMTAIVTGAASASSPFNYYAAPNGSSANQPCTSKANPCDLTTAVSQEGLNSGGASGSVVHLAKGNYTESINFGAGNNNVLIEGKKAKTTSVPAGLNFSGVSGATVSNLTLKGALPVTGNAVVNAGGTNDTLNGAVDAATGPADAILLAAGSTTLHSVSIVEGSGTAACSATSKASPSVASNGWVQPGFVNLKKVPSCANGATSVTITLNNPGPGPTTYTFGSTQSAPKTIQLSNNAGYPGTPNPAIPSGSTVVFHAAIPAAPAYSQAGILAAGGTNTISGGSVAGPTESVAGPGPDGILIAANGTTVSNTSVSGNKNTSTSPSAKPGAGILVNQKSTTITGASANGNDVGVELVRTGVSGPVAETVTGGNFSGGSAGVVIAGLNSLLGDAVTFTANTVSGSGTGAGIEFSSAHGIAIGAAGASNVNTVDGNGVGVAFGQPTGGNGSTANSLTNFSITGNLGFGVEQAGPEAPSPFNGGTTATQNSSGNQVHGSVLNNNGNSGLAAGANIVDFDAYGGPIDATLGLQTTVDIPSGSAPPTSLTLKNNGGSSVTVADGEAITLAGEPEALYVNNGPGISHILAPGTSFTFTVAALAPAEGATTADIPVGTPVTQTYTADAPSDIGSLSGNTSDGTTAACNALVENNPGQPITVATTVDGGYYDC